MAAALARQADMADKLAEALARPGAAGTAPPQDAILQMFIARLDLAEIIMCGTFEPQTYRPWPHHHHSKASIFGGRSESASRHCDTAAACGSLPVADRHVLSCSGSHCSCTSSDVGLCVGLATPTDAVRVGDPAACHAGPLSGGQTCKPQAHQVTEAALNNPCSEYGGSFEAGAGTLRLYVHAVALARAAADAAQQAMEKEFQAIDALKERLQVRVLGNQLLPGFQAAAWQCRP